MKYIFLIVCLLFTTFAYAQQSDVRFYNRNGQYEGKMTKDNLDNKRFYDRNGKYEGLIDKNGRIYSRDNKYLGKMEDKYGKICN